MSNSTSHRNTTDCTSISLDCPLDATIYGYYPNLGANVFFAVIFGILAVAHFALGLRYRCWAFMVALGVGCIGECVGMLPILFFRSFPFFAGAEHSLLCRKVKEMSLGAKVFLFSIGVPLSQRRKSKKSPMR